MLASSTRLGDAYLYVIAPIVIFSALVVWIAMTLLTSRHRWSRRTPGGPAGMPHRGPVQGGVIRGSPAQRTRRDPVTPPVVQREERRVREAEPPSAKGGKRLRRRR
ncbi:hypothetical protein [Actinomadura livida]|uniref:Uncharacterized protein n=1 Tax=Actinomadura livida TaxID=79909 RepID=A0A7W7MWI8_9ACTN|nr:MULTISPECIES: hypothetical protein [Actinomadura]MBB4772864.1 hypothetical protein [Actinomadura catellatispora]GGU13266.1 hypothetical protein GCM10010208_42810 [Actinomadura livida]